MDLTNLPAPAFTALDGVTQGTAALCYIAIGIAAWLRAPADVRTRVFLGFSIANLVVFGIPTFWWLRGTTDPTKLPVAATAAVLAALGVGALLLFHFTQVFPRRRPWIKGSGPQMAVGYSLVPLVIAGLVRFAPSSAGAITLPYVLGFIVFGFPLLVLLGFVLPVAAIVSLLRSHKEVQQGGLGHLKLPLEVILLSQIAGGTLAVVFAPVLTGIARVFTGLAPNSAIQSALIIAIWAFGLLTPLGYAAAVWKFSVLSLDPG